MQEFPELNGELKRVVQDHTAGDPTRKGLLWTHLTYKDIQDRLEEREYSVSRKTVRSILKGLGFVKRRKVLSITRAPSRNRDRQFDWIQKITARYKRKGNPILSLDSKRQEYLGAMYRKGLVLANQQAEVMDHDLPGYATGTVVPHGIYDVQLNKGHLNLTEGADTGEFASKSLGWYWDQIGQADYPKADRLLLLCDCGGSNGFRSHQFKYHLWQLALATGLVIEVAHYPVYCSKYNPIEHRFFCHVEQSWRGGVFDRAEQLADLARETTTTTGLTTTARVTEQTFKPVKDSRGDLLDQVPLVSNKHLPEYNYQLPPTKMRQ